MEAKPEQKFVPIYYFGKRYDVPASLTLMQAVEYTGHQYIRGCGCRGGVCGACASVFVHPNSHHLEVGLACQIQVVSGMRIIQLPYFPVKKPRYLLEELEPTTESVGLIYPQIYRCVACNTCTKMCPQDVRVMDCISAIKRGDIEFAAQASRDCVMCGLCASRCPAEIPQFLAMLLCRRLSGRYLHSPFRYLPTRLAQIEAREFSDELDELMALDTESLKERYQQQQKDKQII